ncbi:MAG: hypothetical protein QOE58_2893, partial [Actinomycetota bacterium]|nr:hypothetical protein [Actinomycetota bacterium]
MIVWKSGMASAAAVLVSAALFSGQLGSMSVAAAGGHPATGVGSCTLKNWDASSDPEDAKDLPQGQRPQTYKPDDYNCTGAKFA